MSAVVDCNVTINRLYIYIYIATKFNDINGFLVRYL